MDLVLTMNSITVNSVLTMKKESGFRFQNHKCFYTRQQLTSFRTTSMAK